MKIVCESCGAKYSIADDRVTGKVFKIRCKRCSEVIIVRGDQQAQQADEPAAAASPADGTAIWHIVVEGEQAGPYTPQQLGEMLTAQTVDWDAYVWTEGFDNWLPMREVTDLVSQITGQGAQAQAAPQQAAVGARTAAYRSAVHETLSGQPSMGADPFADDAGAHEPSLFGNGGAANGPDLFARGNARAAASPFAGSDDGGVVASAPSPRMGAEQVMTGARNENSVLFSLKNLQALATGSGGSGGASLAPATASAGSTGYASGEGSGLIDIRALATTTGMGENAGGGGSRDELLSMGSHGGAFGTLGSPMLAPVSDDGADNKRMLIWAGVAAVFIVSAASVAIIYFMRPAVPQAAPVAMLPQSAPANTVAAAQPPTPEPGAAATDKPSEGELAARNAAATGEPASARDRTGSSEHESRRRRESGKGEGSEPSPAAAAPEKPSAPSKPSGPRSIDDLLDGALSGSSSSKGSKPAESAAANSNLPDNPSREQVMSAMNGVKPAVQSCANGAGGVAMVTVSVAGESGRVTNAQVGGVTGPAGSCIAQAVRKANFPKFKNKVFKIQFPFKL